MNDFAKAEIAKKTLEQYPELLELLMEYTQLNGPLRDKAGNIIQSREVDQAVAAVGAYAGNHNIGRLSSLISDVLDYADLTIIRPPARDSLKGSNSKYVFPNPEQILRLAEKFGAEPKGAFIEYAKSLAPQQPSAAR